MEPKTTAGLFALVIVVALIVIAIYYSELRKCQAKLKGATMALRMGAGAMARRGGRREGMCDGDDCTARYLMPDCAPCGDKSFAELSREAARTETAACSGGWDPAAQAEAQALQVMGSV